MALDKFVEHVGDVNSCHNNARIQVKAFNDQNHSLANVWRSNAREEDIAYRTRLTASLDVTQFLLKQGLPFRGHDESTTSLNRGNFLELLQWYSDRNDAISKVLGLNAPENNLKISPPIQKDLANACASVITSVIVNDIGDKVFTILVDEARDVSVKEQMGVVLRYLNGEGCVVERFIGLVHVLDTCSQTLKDAIDKLFAKHGLSLSKLRGQGYDGASNMRGELSGLKAIVFEENPYAMYVYCFSHQLQLIVVAISKSIMDVKDCFSYVSMIVNTIGASCKRKDQLRILEHERLVKELNNFERASGKVEKELENVCDDSTCPDSKSTARGLFKKMNKYKFVFVMHLMIHLLGKTNELSFALQQKDQHIVQAMSLLDSVKYELQCLRDNGWEIIFDEANRFCEVNNISLIHMEDTITRLGYKGDSITNHHYYRVEIFYEVVDLTIQEMNSHFSEVSTDLLKCMACLDPRNSFSQFDVDQLMRLTILYHEDFSRGDCLCLLAQLRSFVANVRRDSRFLTVNTLGRLAQEMVKTDNHLVFQLVYRMIELALVLLVATAFVERAFSAMKIIKTDSRNRMRDDWMNDCLVVYIEKHIFSKIDNETILQYFQGICIRRGKLSLL